MNNLSTPFDEVEVSKPRNAIQKVNDIVEQMIAQHIGGENFFTNLDYALRDSDLISALGDKTDEVLGNEYTIQVSTGSFGRFFSNWVAANGFDLDKVLVVNGGIREGEPVESLEPFRRRINGQAFTIVDDSYYSGTTARKIREHVESLGGIYKGTFVIYDGSPEKHPDVHSLYRYHK